MGDDITLGQLSAELAAAGKNIDLKASQVVRKIANSVIINAQATVPVDTAATKNSINAVGPTGAPLAKGDLVAEIGPTTWYAPLLEYGTVHMAPRPFMVPALNPWLEQTFQDMLADIGALESTEVTVASEWSTTSPDTDQGPGSTYTGRTGL